MNDKTLLTITAGVAAAALIMATYATVQVSTNTQGQLAVVDAKGVLEAKKLVLLASLRGRDRDMAHLEKTIEASQKLPATLDAALTTLAQRHGVTLIDKAALVKGTALPDLTEELYREMQVSQEEAAGARMAISRTTFGK